MLENGQEVEVERSCDWTHVRAKPEYHELNNVLDGSEAVKRWRRKLRGKPIAKQQVLRAWLWWCKTGEPRLYDLGPDGLIEYQKKVRGTEDEYIILDAIDDWLHATGGMYNTLRSYKSTIRSFFLHNRAELSKDPTSRIKPTRFSQVSMFAIEEIRAIYTVSKPMMKAILVCMVTSGMGCDELLYWSNTGYRSLMAQLEADEPLIRI
ncbi:MAG: hypothetical protein V1924_02810, partial [Candidatus Bathyarchaeota archaeon]